MATQPKSDIKPLKASRDLVFKVAPYGTVQAGAVHPFDVNLPEVKSFVKAGFLHTLEETTNA